MGPSTFAGVLAAAPHLGPAMDRVLASLSSGKEECSVFMDDLITALFVDLRQYRKFAEVERRLKKAIASDDGECFCLMCFLFSVVPHIHTRTRYPHAPLSL